MRRSQDSFQTLPNPKNRPLGLQKVKKKKDPKTKSKINVRIEWKKENESCSTTWVELKTAVDPYSNSKTSPLGPPQDKNDSKIKSN